MYFRINDLIIGGDSKLQITEIEGLGVPEIRTAEGVSASMDGGYVSSQFYKYRTIVITGFYIGDTCEEAENIRKQLSAKTAIRKLHPVYYHSANGNISYTEGYFTDVKIEIKGVRHGEYQITIICPDPLMYDGGDGETEDSMWQSQELLAHSQLSTAAGYVTPYQLPVTWATDSGLPHNSRGNIIYNSSDVAVYPVIVTPPLNGTAIYRKMSVTEGGGILNRISYAKNSGATTYRIDMQQKDIYQGDTDISALTSFDLVTKLEWFKLDPGINIIDSEVATSVRPIIKWKVGYLGV